MTKSNAQKLSVPDDILAELQDLNISNPKKAKDTLFFKAVYPANYDSTKSYPVLLALSGGNQNEKIVNYCYAAWFKSEYFKNYITILPVNKKDKNLLEYSKGDIQLMLTIIKDKLNVSAKNWIIAGTSNGGLATFKFIAEEPSLFEGAIVIPGAIEDKSIVKNSWAHLKIVLAYGDKDAEDWIKGTEMTKEILNKYVSKVDTVVLKEQGHILALDFDIDFVYKIYFEDHKN